MHHAILAGQSTAESAALLLLGLGWLVVGVMWLRLLRRRRGKAKTSRWMPIYALILGPLVGAAMWAGFVYLPESDITDYERLEILPQFLGMGFLAGMILAFVLGAASICDDAEIKPSVDSPESTNDEDPTDDASAR